MTKQKAMEKLSAIYTAIDKRIDGYVDYIDNGRQWQEQKDLNKMYMTKLNKISKLMDVLALTMDNADIEIQTKPETEKRWFGDRSYVLTKYRLIENGSVLIEV